MKYILLAFVLILFSQFSHGQGFGNERTQQIDKIIPDTASQVTIGDDLHIDGVTRFETSLDGFIKLSSGVMSMQDFIDLSTDVSGVLTIAQGGTNSNTALTNDKVMVSDTGSIKESSITATELGFLSGVTSNIQTQLDLKANDLDVVHLTGDESISGVKTFTGQFVAVSTANGNRPCPVMTEVQRDAVVSPSEGDCVVNSDTDQLNYYLSSAWGQVGGGGGGVSKWVTAADYEIDDIVFDTVDFYKALTTHTSTVLATDITNGDMIKMVPVTPTTTEGDLILRGSSEDERLAIGTTNYYLKSNGTTASWQPVTASASFTTVTKSASTTLLTTGEENVMCSTSGGDVTLTLPTAVGNNGLTYKFSNLSDSNTCIIDANAAETIGGELTVDMESVNDSFIIASDNVNWYYLSDDISVSFNGETTAGANISHATTTTVKITTVIQDTHDAYDSVTGLYTVEVPGVYKACNHHLLTGSSAWETGEQFRSAIVMGTETSYTQWYEISTDSGSTIFVGGGGCTQALLDVGDTIYSWVYQTSDVTIALYTTSGTNRLSVTRIK